MQPLFEHRLELAGYRTRALELEGEGPPLLLFHGYADSADTWRPLLDRLARRDRRAVAVDLPGFGTADRLSPGRPILPQLRAFGTEAVRAFAPDGGAVVCGNSLGGCLAMLLAEDPALDLAGVVPVAPAGLDMARWFALLERDPGLRLLLAAPVPVPGFVVRRVVGEIYRRLAFARPGDIDPLVTSTFASHFENRETAARHLATARRMLPELRDPFELERIGCPVMLVWGTEDLLVFQKGAERVLEAVTDARVELLDGCGHCPQIEVPERMADLLLGFAEPLAHVA